MQSKRCKRSKMVLSRRDSGKIEKAGGIVALPKHAIMGMAWQGYFLDTEGNTLGIHQPDPNAK